jgi:predicted nucleotidyltransferase component of viral defense system
MIGPPRNTAASVKHRLLNIARQQGINYQSVLTRYASERLLYRISRSKYGDRFYLKGAYLFTLWLGSPQRATRDLDLLGFGEFNEQIIGEMFHVFCKLEVQQVEYLFSSNQ